MKAIIIIAGVVLGILIGLFPKGFSPKPLWYKILTIFLVSMTIAVTILPPIAGTLSDSTFLSRIGRDKAINVRIDVSELEKSFDKEKEYWIFREDLPGEQFSNQLIVAKKELPAEFKDNNVLVILSKFDKELEASIYHSTEYINPIMTLPYIPDLEERAKILNFHVPMSWVGVLAYLISMVYSILYLKKRDFADDTKASAAAYLGVVFTILATVTGMIWAKFNWGAFWNWDPRQTSIFILLLIYFAYFTLRASIDNQELKARLSAVYSIIAFITVPFLVFILPRMLTGLHPGSADDSTTGPILSATSESLNFYKQITFSLALFAFTLVFFWTFNIFVRFKNLKDRFNGFFN